MEFAIQTMWKLGKHCVYQAVPGALSALAKGGTAFKAETPSVVLQLNIALVKEI
jgi:hypothetical protein